jgi:hypothetical protein
MAVVTKKDNSSTVLSLSNGQHRVRDTGLRPIENGLKFKQVMMTPEMAQELLGQLPEAHRRKKDQKIVAFANDMKAGNWRLTHQGICINMKGELVDGMNRLHAVIRADCAVPMTIAYNLDPESSVALDCGTNRSIVDSARILGITGLTNNHVSTIRRMLAGVAHKINLTYQETLDAIDFYQKGLDFAFEAMHKNQRGITGAPTRAVIARAYYSQPKARLRDFGRIMLDGLPDNPQEDKAVIILRNWLLKSFLSGARERMDSQPRPEAVYLRVEYALRAFINKDPITKLEEAEKELFTIPKMLE